MEKLWFLCILIIYNSIGFIFTTFYEINLAARPTCIGLEKIPNLSTTQCVLLCEQKNLVASMEKDGQCMCLREWCLSENQKSSTITVFKKTEIPELFGGKGSSASNPAKSCKEIKNRNTNLKKSGFYWIKLNRPTRVYCDMITDGGGWLMIGNATSTTNQESYLMAYEYLYQNANITSLDSLSEVNKGRFLLSGTKFTELSRYTDFKQLRVLCTKPYHGRTFHMMSNANASGEVFKKYVSYEVAAWLNVDGARCSSTFSRLPDDNSMLAQMCLSNKVTSGDYSRGTGGRLYDHFIFKERYYVVLDSRWVICDDSPNTAGYNRVGSWHYYVR